jgi:hypothetical protein
MGDGVLEHETVVCAAILGNFLARPELETVPFAIPFLDAWFFVLVLLVVGFFGRTEVRLGPGGLEERWALLGLRGGRHVPLDEVEGVTEFARVVDSRSGRTAHGLRFLTHGRSVRLALGTEAEERQSLAALLEGDLQALQGGSTPAVAPAAPAVDVPSRGDHRPLLLIWTRPDEDLRPAGPRAGGAPQGCVEPELAHAQPAPR